MAARPDPFIQAHQDAQKAVATFLPSLVGRSDAPPPPPNPMAPPLHGADEALRVLSIARKAERMSARVVRGLPPDPPPPTPEQAFGNNLDSVHTRAIQEAIASFPEEQRGNLISEAHDSAVKWIGAHNGKVVVHGKVEIASSPESAERLAAKIVNNEVEGHDQRRAAERTAALGQPASGVSGAAGSGAPASGSAPDRPSNTGGGSDAGGAVVPPSQGSTPQAAAPVVPHAGPEIVPPGDGQPPSTGIPPAVSGSEAARVGTRANDGHQITQPKNSVAANQKLALQAAPELDQALATLTQQVPGTKYDRIRPQKATDRIGQKVEDNNDPNTLSDYLGAQVAADTPAAKDKLVDLLKKNFNVIEVDDEFLGGREDKAQYPSANVQVQLSNGMTAEVQIVPKEVQDATEESHGFYKAGREAEERGDNDERDRQWKQAAAINQGQLDKFKQRNGITDNQNVGGYEVLGNPIKIGSHTFLRVRQGNGSGSISQGGPATPSADVNTNTGEEHSGDERPGGILPADASAGESPAPPVSRSLAKGQTVTLKDGTSAKVAYADPEGKFIRVRTADGTNLRQLDPNEDLADAGA